MNFYSILSLVPVIMGISKNKNDNLVVAVQINNFTGKI